MRDICDEFLSNPLQPFQFRCIVQDQYDAACWRARQRSRMKRRASPAPEIELDVTRLFAAKRSLHKRWDFPLSQQFPVFPPGAGFRNLQELSRSRIGESD